jgi:hypothetical protein
MSDFPEGVTAPDGAQKLVDVCKGTWAVIHDESSEIRTHDKAVDRFEAAMHELAELEVHVNNEGGYPVFSLGVKETACDPSALVARCWSTFSETAVNGRVVDVDHRGRSVEIPHVY